MVDIDELRNRLKDDTTTFTALEVRALLDYSIEHAHRDEYNQARIAQALQQAQEMEDIAKAAIQDLAQRWDNSPMVPTLQVVSYEQA